MEKVERFWKKLVLYIHDYNDKKVSIRQEIMAPEIDEYDVVSYKNIISWEIEIWEKVEYKL